LRGCRKRNGVIWIADIRSIVVKNRRVRTNERAKETEKREGDKLNL